MDFIHVEPQRAQCPQCTRGNRLSCALETAGFLELLEEFPAPLGVSQVALAAHLEISLQRINEIIRGKRGVTPETAWLFSQAFGTTPEFWINLQANFDLARSYLKRAVRRLRKAS